MGKVYKIVFLGNTSVGKTTLISQYLYLNVQNPAPTIGIDFLSTTHDVNGQQIRLQLWDTAGQERFHSIIGNYTRNTSLAVIVFSIEDVRSLDKVESWIEDFVLIHNKKEEINIMIVANKMDVKIEEFDRCYERAMNVCDRYGAKLVTTSALDRHGIRDMADGIDEFVKKDLEKSALENEEGTRHNAIKVIPRKRGCC